uniref:Uncharacterized protein n=1 Tax=Globodera rostochiensis TaxID=31243 RepID=A0A914GWJ9_GLORO
MSSKSAPANEKSKISAGPTNFAKAASERSQTRRPKPKAQNSGGVPMKKYSHSSITSTPTILWPKPTAPESAQIRPPESERLTRKPYNLLDANCALDDFAAIDDGTMLRNPQAQGRSQSFRHRPVPRTCGTAATARTTTATADTSQERRRSTPTITRRCSLQNRTRVEPRIDAWPEPKQRSEAEERFLALPDACDYTRVRQFNIDAKGAVIARGDSFRRKRQQQVVHAQRSNPLATVNASSGGGGADTATEQNGDTISTASGGKLTERPASVGLPLHGASSRSASSVSSGGGGVGLAAVGAVGIIADSDTTNKCMSPMATGDVDEAASTSAATLRICLIGQSGSGKSSLIRRFISSEYRNVFADELPDDATCDTQNCSVSINIGGHECDLNFTECDQQMVKQRDFHAYLLVYSIDRKTSFRVALRALEELREKHCPAPIILVGNKMDLERKRAVMENEVKNVVLTHDVPHFQVSVALNHDVDDLLVGIVAQIKEAFQMSITTTKGGQNIRRISQASKDGFDSDFQAAIRRFSRRKKRQMGLSETDADTGGKCTNLFAKLRRWRKGTANL